MAPLLAIHLHQEPFSRRDGAAASARQTADVRPAWGEGHGEGLPGKGCGAPARWALSAPIAARSAFASGRGLGVSGKHS